MSKQLLYFSTCILTLISTACSTTKQAARTSASPKSPQFIDNIALSGGSREVKTGHRTQRPQYQFELNEEDIMNDETMSSLADAILSIQKGKRNNVDLYSFIEDWYGTPYRFGGSTRSGIDCSAFVQKLYENVYNLSLNRTSREQFSSSNKTIKDIEKLREGDLVFFKIRTKRISHVGVYLGDGNFVHASRSKGVVISSLKDNYWSRYYVGGGRMRS